MTCIKTSLWCVQVQLKEYVKLNDTIYEVDPKEEDCFRLSRHLNFKVRRIFTYHPMPTSGCVDVKGEDTAIKHGEDIFTNQSKLQQHEARWSDI